jgi:membrane protein implicated in regulation of membrane protease activity
MLLMIVGAIMLFMGLLAWQMDVAVTPFFFFIIGIILMIGATIGSRSLSKPDKISKKRIDSHNKVVDAEEKIDKTSTSYGRNIKAVINFLLFLGMMGLLGGIAVLQSGNYLGAMLIVASVSAIFAAYLINRKFKFAKQAREGKEAEKE